MKRRTFLKILGISAVLPKTGADILGAQVPPVTLAKPIVPAYVSVTDYYDKMLLNQVSAELGSAFGIEESYVRQTSYPRLLPLQLRRGPLLPNSLSSIPPHG